MREIQMDTGGGFGTETFLILSNSKPPDTAYWRFDYCLYGGGTSDVAFDITATRTGGPYNGYWIKLKWYFDNNQLEWFGCHPGTPDGVDSIFE